MKRLLLSFCLLLACYSGFAQSPYFDALTLRKFAVKNVDGPITITRAGYATPEQKNILAIIKRKQDSLSLNLNADTRNQLTQSITDLGNKKQAIDNLVRDSLFSILKIYFPDLKTSDNNLSQDSLDRKLNNPFFKVSIGALRSQDGINLLDIAGGVSSLGGLDVTNFADGLSKFLIKRAKEELLMAFFDQIKDPAKFPEFKQVFPNTATVVDNFNSWEYLNVVNTIREAFNKDLQDILIDVPKLKDLDPDKKKTGSNDDFYDKQTKARLARIKHFLETDEGRILISAMRIGDGFVKGSKIPDVINDLAGDGYLGGLSNADAKNVIKLINILSFSIRSNDLDQSYIATADIAAMDGTTRKIFAGLLFQQIKNEHIVISGYDVAAHIQTTAAEMDKYITYAITLSDKAIKIDKSIKDLKDAKAKGDTALAKYWSASFTLTVQFFQYAGNISAIQPSFKLPAGLQKAISLSSAALGIANDINTKNYSGAIVGTAKLIADNVNTSNPQDAADVQAFVIKYGSFAANMVQAKNSDEVEQAIETVALPAGSFTIKQKSIVNISLNGYVGYGWDFSRVELPLNSRNLYANGVYAPVGFSASLGGKKGKGAFTLFASVIDVGSLVAYNLGADSTKKLKQAVRLESIFSPSAQLCYEVPRWPITFAAGWRRTPKLFFSNDTAFKVVDPKGVFNLSILIDIPILTLYNKPRNLTATQ